MYVNQTFLKNLLSYNLFIMTFVYHVIGTFLQQLGRSNGIDRLVSFRQVLVSAGSVVGLVGPCPGRSRLGR